MNTDILVVPELNEELIASKIYIYIYIIREQWR